MECWAPLAPAPFQFFIILNNCCTLRQMVDDGDRAVVLLILYITYHSISVHIPSHDRWRDRDLYRLLWSRTGIMGSTRSEWFIEYNCRWFATVIYGFRVGWNWWSMDRDGSMDEVTTDDLLRRWSNGERLQYEKLCSNDEYDVKICHDKNHSVHSADHQLSSLSSNYEVCVHCITNWPYRISDDHVSHRSIVGDFQRMKVQRKQTSRWMQEECRCLHAPEKWIHLLL